MDPAGELRAGRWRGRIGFERAFRPVRVAAMRAGEYVEGEDAPQELGPR
jgi:hypothetical protein